MAHRRVSPTQMMPVMMMSTTDTLTNHLDMARLRVMIFSALQGLVGFVALGWSLIGQLLDATYYPLQTIIPVAVQNTTQMYPLGNNMLPFSVFYDTAITGVAMLVCSIFGLLFGMRSASYTPTALGFVNSKHEVSSSLGTLPLFIAFCIASISGTFYLVHQNMLPFSIMHPWEFIGATKITVYYACRLGLSVVGLLVNLFGCDAGLRQLHLMSQIAMNNRVIDLYETFARGNAIAATVEALFFPPPSQTARNSVSTINAPEYAQTENHHTQQQSQQQYARAPSALPTRRPNQYQRAVEQHRAQQQTQQQQQVVELTEQQQTIVHGHEPVTGRSQSVESETVDELMNTSTSVIMAKDNNKTIIVAEKTTTETARVGGHSVDNESQSGAAVLSVTGRRSMYPGRLSR